MPAGNTCFNSKMRSSRSKANFFSASLRSLDDYSEQLLVIGAERLEARGDCEIAHSGSDLSNPCFRDPR
jgi:hypothetical protein